PADRVGGPEGGQLRFVPGPGAGGGGNVLRVGLPARGSVSVGRGGAAGAGGGKGGGSLGRRSAWHARIPALRRCERLSTPHPRTAGMRAFDAERRTMGSPFWRAIRHCPSPKQSASPKLP